MEHHFSYVYHGNTVVCDSDVFGYLSVGQDECEQLENGRAEAGGFGIEGSMGIREGGVGSCFMCDQVTAVFCKCNSSSF